MVFGDDEMFELTMMGGACDGAESAAVSFWECSKWSKACLLCWRLNRSSLSIRSRLLLQEN